MQIATRQWIAIAGVCGTLVYFCEWLELVFPGYCNQNLAFTIFRMYVLPLILCGILGFYCFDRPSLCWLSFMLPSWIVRIAQLISTGDDGSLWPLVAVIDSLHLIITGLVVLGASRLGQIKDKRESGPTSPSPS